MQSASERNRGIQRKQELVLPAIKRAECHIDALRPVITYVWPDIDLLHRFPVHAQRNFIVIGGRADKGDIARITDALVIQRGKYPVRGEDTPTISIGETFGTNADGQIMEKIIGQVRVDAIPFRILDPVFQENLTGPTMRMVHNQVGSGGYPV